MRAGKYPWEEKQRSGKEAGGETQGPGRMVLRYLYVN